MNTNVAQMELMVLQTQAKNWDWIDAVTEFTNANVSQEIVFRLKELWDQTEVITGQVFEVGKIIVLKIIDFIKANHHTAIGIAIGAAIGALTSMIPFIGPMLAPLATVVGGLIGGATGTRLDRIAKGEISASDTTNSFESLIIMAKEFFKLFAEIFIALKEYFTK